MKQYPKLIIIGMLEGIRNVSDTLGLPIYHLQRDLVRPVDEDVDTPFYEIIEALKIKDTAYESLQMFSINYSCELESVYPKLNMAIAFELLMELGLEIYRHLDTNMVYQEGRLHYTLDRVEHTALFLIRDHD